MGRGELGQEAVAVSGSAAVELRRRALADAASRLMVVGADSRVLMAAGGEREVLGRTLAEVIDAEAHAAAIDEAISRAREGAEVPLSVTLPAGGEIQILCMPLLAEPGADPLVLVVVSRDRRGAGDVDELRARADELDKLAAATRALARSTYPEEVGPTICEVAGDVAGCELAALIEFRPNGSGLMVAASTGAELVGRSAALERATMAGRALSSGRPSFSADLDAEDPERSWPLAHAGALSGLWQPLGREVGGGGAIALGWRRPLPAPGERLLRSLGVIAGEAAVALDRAAALERLTGMARTDPLTEISNRRAWQDELARELARAERGGMRLSVGLIDLDELKAYNDRYGHAAGDRVLLTAAARWRRRLRLTDLLARVGGDEFAVGMPGCSLGEAVALGDQLRGALPDGLSCSIGVTEWTAGESARQLLARADEALYAAKNAGRDTTISLPAPI